MWRENIKEGQGISPKEMGTGRKGFILQGRRGLSAKSDRGYWKSPNGEKHENHKKEKKRSTRRGKLNSPACYEPCHQGP